MREMVNGCLSIGGLLILYLILRMLVGGWDRE